MILQAYSKQLKLQNEAYVRLYSSFLVNPQNSLLSCNFNTIRTKKTLQKVAKEVLPPTTLSTLNVNPFLFGAKAGISFVVVLSLYSFIRNIDVPENIQKRILTLRGGFQIQNLNQRWFQRKKKKQPLQQKRQKALPNSILFLVVAYFVFFILGKSPFPDEVDPVLVDVFVVPKKKISIVGSVKNWISWLVDFSTVRPYLIILFLLVFIWLHLDITTSLQEYLGGLKKIFPEKNENTASSIDFRKKNGRGVPRIDGSYTNSQAQTEIDQSLFQYVPERDSENDPVPETLNDPGQETLNDQVRITFHLKKKRESSLDWIKKFAFDFLVQLTKNPYPSGVDPFPVEPLV